jgi:hypothetical protein
MHHPRSRLGLLTAALLAGTPALAQNNSNAQFNAASPRAATFSEGRLVHDVFRDGKKGMEVHWKVEVSGMKDRELEVACYFKRKDGTPLKDENGSFRTTTGNVSVGDREMVKYEPALFGDFTLFIPHSELHAGPGKHDLTANCEAFDSGKSLGKSGYLSFTLSVGEAVPKEAEFGAGFLKHDVVRDGVKGIEVHHPLTVQAMKDRELEVTCFFWFSDGRKLKDFNQRYRAADGQVSTSDRVQVKFPDAKWADFTVFLPYDELHMSSGTSNLKVQCEAFDAGQSIGKSGFYPFTFTKP